MCPPTAFEPLSLALAASVFENAWGVRSPPHSLHRTVPRARIWLRRQTRPVLSSLLQEGAEPVLDGVLNHLVLEPRLLCATGLGLLLLLWVVAQMHHQQRANACASSPTRGPHALVLLLLLCGELLLC